MSETTTIRLMKAAKEFNVGKTTIVEFLSKKGFTVDNKPDPVLGADMYEALISEFDADRAAKLKSEKVVLDKQKEEQKIIAEKKAAEEKKAQELAAKAEAEKIKAEVPEIEGPKVLGKIDLEKKKNLKRKPLRKQKQKKHQK
jgi:translation initiation factor IF-2